MIKIITSGLGYGVSPVLFAQNSIEHGVSNMIPPGAIIRDLEDDFHVFGVIRSVWVARRPPGYAFIDFDDRRDALDAIRELDDDEESAQCLLSGLLIRSLSISTSN
ncbi:RS-containing zinc finger protein [Trifolium repens]|nr:RS-containing zinc finger protein [Trifolium repens]